MKLLAKSVLVIFLLWGAVRWLNTIYPTLKRAPLDTEVAARAPYTDADRARDEARSKYLQRELERNPALADAFRRAHERDARH